MIWYNTATSTGDSSRAGSSSGFSSSTTRVTSGNTGFSFGASYSVVGLNVEGVDAMREAIRNWVNEIKTHLDGIEPLANASNAFRSQDGQVETAVKQYIDNCKTYYQNLTSNLLAFSDKLEDVKQAWIKTTGNIAGTITSDTQATDAGSAYQETL